MYFSRGVTGSQVNTNSAMLGRRQSAPRFPNFGMTKQITKAGGAGCCIKWIPTYDSDRGWLLGVQGFLLRPPGPRVNSLH
jgi:hypothetical protein